MSKLSGLTTFTKRQNSGIKPIRNVLGSLYSATTILSRAAADGAGGVPPHIPGEGHLTLNDSSDLTLSTGQSMEIMG
jgi:hypothetical protein